MYTMQNVSKLLSTGFYTLHALPRIVIPCYLWSDEAGCLLVVCHFHYQLHALECYRSCMYAKCKMCFQAKLIKMKGA